MVTDYAAHVKNKKTPFCHASENGVFLKQFSDFGF